MTNPVCSPLSCKSTTRTRARTHTHTHTHTHTERESDVGFLWSQLHECRVVVSVPPPRDATLPTTSALEGNRRHHRTAALPAGCLHGGLPTRRHDSRGKLRVHREQVRSVSSAAWESRAARDPLMLRLSRSLSGCRYALNSLDMHTGIMQL